MKRRAVHSETFTSLGYDPDHHCLETEFRDGDVYRYFAVPAGVWRQFQAAVSKGRFFASHIRARYAFAKVQRSPKERK